MKTIGVLSCPSSAIWLSLHLHHLFPRSVGCSVLLSSVLCLSPQFVRILCRLTLQAADSREQLSPEPEPSYS
ncbi:hypothetical protein BDV12DRAFT_165252 [Aspergillus spectabilis]